MNEHIIELLIQIKLLLAIQTAHLLKDEKGIKKFSDKFNYNQNNLKFTDYIHHIKDTNV